MRNHGCTRPPAAVVDIDGRATESLVLAGFEPGCAIALCDVHAALWREEAWPRGRRTPARQAGVFSLYLAHGPLLLEYLRWWGDEDIDPDRMLALYGVEVRR